MQGEDSFGFGRRADTCYGLVASLEDLDVSLRVAICGVIELTSINNFTMWVQMKPVAPVTKTFLLLFDIFAIADQKFVEEGRERVFIYSK